MNVPPAADAGVSLFALAFAFGLGVLAWPLLEYFIHGILSHKYRTFASPLHWSHHKNPRAVLTAPFAWVPSAVLIWAVLALIFGWALALAAILGVLLGFARYERFHWRVHYDRPRSERERVLFAHHLAHHYRNPKVYHGVTTRFYDRLFGTLPADCEADYARMFDREPLVPEDTWAVYRLDGLREMISRIQAGRRS